MDNLTHTLTGMLIAEAVCARARAARPAFRTAAFVTSALANNLPDIDPVYTWITRPRPLGSLLHHRGHTHTLILAVPGGLLVALAVLAWLARKHGRFAHAERRWVWGLGVLGAGLHIAMDYGNNYGVHPFWPFYSGWFYGDSIFIIEPLWLAVALPALAFAVAGGGLRWTFFALLAVLIGLAVRLPFIRWGTLVALLSLAAISGAVSGLGTARVRIATALASCVSIALCFVALAMRSERVLRADAARDFPQLRVVDVVTTPMPGNPLCWNAFVVGTVGLEYRVLSANVAPLPTWTTAAACPYDADAQPSARWTSITASPRAELLWRGQYSYELAALRAQAAQDCGFRALLRFARVPYLALVMLPGSHGQLEPVAGDVRFDRSPNLDFSDMRLAGSGECPRFVPPWIPPRAELLGDTFK